MPEILVVDLANVTIDGIPAGSVTDVLANHDPSVTLKTEADDGGFRGALLNALSVWSDARLAAHSAERKSLCDAHVAADAEKDAAHSEALAAKDATITEQQALIDTLGGTELGRKMAKDAARQAALDAKAEAEARLAELDEVHN